MTIRLADVSEMDVIRELFREYATQIIINLCFQGFEEELAGLPGKYGPPKGALLLADAGNAIAGCVAVRPIEADACELKRMFVRPEFRGHGVGRALAEAAIQQATNMGYRQMRLDTLTSMTHAIALYRALGFKEISQYCENPHAALYFERALVADAVA